ncbi:hypothetical protein N7493_005482 [Penicillium malachiteum]|uniref:Translation elongation factor IF5A C-terminal domain-containing protein n=1 Tax=Penicillium malachiteum TaxID=1324776 RepID=A0AAD6MWV4_9EURO|nr:hypothetical protein N7493_005482 [Penicillium malachiteum]
MGSYDNEEPTSSEACYKTKETSCSNIALGQFILLQGRPCQITRISGPSTATGQYTYLGIDLATKQLHEESSKASATDGSDQIVQVLDLEEWGILDLEDGSATGIDEKGDVKQAAILEENNLWTRLNAAFESCKGSVRGLILSERGKNLIVEMKVVTKATE